MQNRKGAGIKQLWIVSTGSGGISRRVPRHIRRHFPEDSLVLTESKEHTQQCVRESTADLTIIAGGDGAWREALETAKEDQLLGFLPAGTLNQTRLELGAPSLVTAWHEWHERTVYLGRANAGKSDIGQARGGKETIGFFLMLGAGVEADAVAMVRPGLKSTLGRFAYLVAIFERLIRPVKPCIEVTISDHSWRTCQVLVQRGRYYAGPFPVAPEASVFRPEYRVLIWKRSGRMAWCMAMAARMFRLPCRWLVEDVAAESLEIKGDVSAATQVDGDPGPELPLAILPACPRRIAIPGKGGASV